MPRRPTLLVVGNGTISTYPVVREPFEIGHAPDCDVVIPHPSVAPRHAVIRLGPPLTVQHLGSSRQNHVTGELRLGGGPIPHALGDSFQVGIFSCILFDGAVNVGSDRDSASSEVGAPIRVEVPTIDEVPDVVRTIAASSTSVLVLGETGVGKEVLSRSIHRLSDRRGPLLCINCGAIPEALLESELFGHQKGSFTGAATQKIGLLEAADGGTVFLDEIGELSPLLQVKLLRVLESGEIMRVGAVQPIALDVRFISATHRNLSTEIANGRFRADLYYRLDGVSLKIPPLRDRPGQIIPLALHFIATMHTGRAHKSLATTAFLARLEAHDWPGNVRELKATVERAVLLANGRDLMPAHVMFSNRAPSHAISTGPANVVVTDSPDELDERARIITALEAYAGNQTRAARSLGVSRATLVTKLARYRIPRPRV